MSNVIMMPNRRNSKSQFDIANGDLRALCRHVEKLDRMAAETLQLEIKQWLAGALMRVDYGVYVEDCLHPVRDAADVLCWSMKTLNTATHADAIEKSRRWLIDCITVLEEELRLCPPIAVAI